MLIFLVISIVSAQVDYVHIFAQEWPGGVCRAEKCQKEFMNNYDGQRWNLHGLWPNKVQPTYCQQISECRAETYDQESLSAQTKELVDLTWVGLYSDTQVFRKHEWEKHGTCYPGEVTQNTYFYLVSSLSLHYNVYDILADYGIIPQNQAITDADIKGAFLKRFGSKADVHYSCEKVDGKFYLGQVKFCFDNDLQIRSCKCTATANAEPLVSCGSLFYYAQYEPL